jgi:outer membrane protein assembly factor BamB
MRTRGFLLVSAILGVFSLGAWAADWPQWRGPQRDGISKETGLLKGWPKEGPKQLWQEKDIGFGYSTPAVVGDHLYLLSNKGDDEFVQSLAVKDGKQGWSTRIGKVGPNRVPQYPGARSTPTVDGQVLYALGSDGDLVCLTTATGAQKWKKNLRSDFGGKPGAWAYAESPLIDGDVLVCTPGGKEATLVALVAVESTRARRGRGWLRLRHHHRGRRRQAVCSVHAEWSRGGGCQNGEVPVAL